MKNHTGLVLLLSLGLVGGCNSTQGNSVYLAQSRPVIKGNSQKCIYVYGHKENTTEYDACVGNLAKFDSLNPMPDPAVVHPVTVTDTTERNWAGLDAHQQEAMRNLSIHFQEQAAKEQAALNDWIQRNYEAQHRKYEDDKIRADIRRCIDEQLAKNPYKTDTSVCR